MRKTKKNTHTVVYKRERSFYDARFFKPKVANFVAISGNRGAQKEFSVLIKVSK